MTFGDKNLKIGGFCRTIWQAVVAYRRSLVLALLALIGFVLIVNGSYYVISAKPEACLVCHYMKPYYDQWRNSAHKSVGCIECHPGRRTLIDSYLPRYLTASYNRRPQADVKTISCLKCHSEDALKGDIIYQRGIKFNHEFHLGQLRRGKKLRCTSCHATGMPDAHLSVDTEACFLCHFKDAEKGRSFTPCNDCHGMPQGKVQHQGFEFDHSAYAGTGIECSSCHTVVVKGDGRVPDSRCYECHVERLEAKQDLNALHRIHITEHGVDCFRCHERIVHGKVEMAQPFTLECTKCHAPQHSSTAELYIGTGGEGVPNTPSAMFTAQVSCEACHTGRVPSDLNPTAGTMTTWTEKKAACVKCHGKGFDLMLDDWKAQLDRLAIQTKQVFDQAEERGRSLPAGKIVEREELRKARINSDLLFKGHAVHNPFFALKLAGQVVQAADTVARAIGIVKPTPPALLAKPDAACRMCHTHMPFPETIKFERMEFPHGLHADVLELSCTKCHSSGRHRERVITKSECMECHHTQAEISCNHCHYEQNGLYTGNLPELSIKDQPDKMSAGGVSCKDCHSSLASGKPVRAAVREQCIVCHDESYGKMLDDWLRKGDDVITRLTSRLDSLTAQGPTGQVDSVAWNKSLEQAQLLLDLLKKGKAPHNHIAFDKQAVRIDGLLNNLPGKVVAAAKQASGKP